MSLSGLLTTAKQNLEELFFPAHCLVCKTAGDWLCETCLQQITYLPDAVCVKCGLPQTGDLCEQCTRLPLENLTGIRSAAYFTDPLRPAIHAFKYKNVKAAATTLATILAGTYHRYKLRAELIVPVPLHPTRFRERGYNQCQLLAQHLSADLNLPIDKSLRRVRHTAVQMELTGPARQENVADAFHCTPTLANQKILLIDDVCTTGSTLDACAQALTQAGATAVWGLTLARAASNNKLQPQMG